MKRQATTAHDLIVEWVEPGASVLELGCGRGDLLARLVSERGVKAQGIDIDEASIFPCVEKGLNVLHEDIDAALGDYASGAFDYTIFDESLQCVVRRPDQVITEALRISTAVIIGFSNFAHFRARAQIFFEGRTPITSSLPFAWYDTPNLHFLSIRDFMDYCESRQIRVEQSVFLGGNGPLRLLPNVRAVKGFFLITKPSGIEEDNWGRDSDGDIDASELPGVS
jgi:methionine biosynthesis protein MetW